MDRAPPSPAPAIAAAAAAASGSSFAMILSALLIVATIMGAMAFCVWMCGCRPEDVIRGRGGGGGANARSSLAAVSKPGMSKQAIEKALPVMSYGAARLLASQRMKNPELGCCSICLAEFGKQDDFIRVMPGCGHCFHSECIALWLVAHSSCPVCRRSLLGVESQCCKNCGRITARNPPPPPPLPPPPPPPTTRDLSFSEAVVCYSVQLQAPTIPIPAPETSTAIQLEEVVIEVPPDDCLHDHPH